MDFSGVTRHGADRWLYQQIADLIAEAIESGELRPRQQVPTEKDLMDATGASRQAVRHAIADLRERGYLYTVPQLGSFVAEPNSELSGIPCG
jgi:DNA-binding GntR family transcriptional regulator